MQTRLDGLRVAGTTLPFGRPKLGADSAVLQGLCHVAEGYYLSNSTYNPEEGCDGTNETLEVCPAG